MQVEAVLSAFVTIMESYALYYTSQPTSIRSLPQCYIGDAPYKLFVRLHREGSDALVQADRV